MSRVHEVADTLRGSAGSLADHTTIEERDSYPFLDELDSLVLQCSGCGWWFDAEEIDTETGDTFCTDCLPTQEPES